MELNKRQLALLDYLMKYERYGRSKAIDKMELILRLRDYYNISPLSSQYSSRYQIAAYRKMSTDIQVLNEYAETNNHPVIMSKSGVGVYLATVEDLADLGKEWEAALRKMKRINNKIRAVKKHNQIDIDGNELKVLVD